MRKQMQNLFFLAWFSLYKFSLAVLIWCWQEREQGKASSYCGSVCGRKNILEWQQDYYAGEGMHPRRLNDDQPFTSCRILWLETFALLCFGFKSLFYHNSTVSDSAMIDIHAQNCICAHLWSAPFVRWCFNSQTTVFIFLLFCLSWLAG